MAMAKTKHLVYVGIDVAFAKKKRLPISVCEISENTLRPLPLKRAFEKPPIGQGNFAILRDGVLEKYLSEVAQWFRNLESKKGVKIQTIAIDSPSNYCDPLLPCRLSEKELTRKGIKCFFTPSEQDFKNKIKASLIHIQKKGEESCLPNANLLWMIVGIRLFKTLKMCGYRCIETYPQAIVHELKCNKIHKSSEDGYQKQIQAAAKATGYTSSSDLEVALREMGFGNRDDKLDAYLSAWVASLPQKYQKIYGQGPNDAIITPNLDEIQKQKSRIGDF